MNFKTLTEIDFFRIRDQVAQYCLSEEGRENLLAREPLKKTAEIEKLKNLSREWALYLSHKHANPPSGWTPVKPLLPLIKTNGAALTLEQLRSIGQFVTSVKKVKEGIALHQTALELKLLPKELELIPDFSETEKKVFRVITPEGEMRDLPEISAIRKKIANLNSKIKTIMQGFTSDQKLSGVLESSVPVLRNGRQVLAVKASLQNRIPGIIHEVSQSAQTVYIEPEEAVLCSNELIQLEFELQAVIKKILTEVTASLQPSIPLLRDALPVMILLDTTLAAERWGSEHNCNYAQISENQPPVLVQARHPLLGEKAVPIDIRFMEGKRVLIITGPNTGGKTVSLKTFALLSMLNQAGFPIPAAEGTCLPVFSNVFADIGDDQSLDQSLSTFSGHMKNIAQAVNAASSDTLVLLDELGSGTDPQEGTAIAMAVLDELIKKQSFVLVTTHQGILKNYGYTNPSCINASVEFNQDTLSPSYHLLMGVPGESHALDIAKRSGLPGSIVSKAKSYITSEQADVSSLIKGLTQKHAELDRREKAFRDIENRQKEKLLKQEQKDLKLRQKENELKERESRSESGFLRETRKSLENLVRELREGEITREKTLKMRKFINDLTEDVELQEMELEEEKERLEEEEKQLNERIENETKIAENGMKISKSSDSRTSSNKKTKKRLSNKEALATAKATYTDEEIFNLAPRAKNAPKQKFEFCEGAEVLVGKTRSRGTLLHEEKKGVWTVQLGSIRMSIKQKDMELIAPSNLSVADYTVELNKDNGNGSPAFELRLLGMREEEAVLALQKQLDLCAMTNFKSFSVIHGKGNGILQQAVQDYLSNYPGVKSFYYARPEDGGFGKTYVELN